MVPELLALGGLYVFQLFQKSTILAIDKEIGEIKNLTLNA
jgi:hypothetical protein